MIAKTTDEIMNRNKAAVVSLHFSPAHASHMIALGKLLREFNYSITFVLDEKYLSMADFEGIGRVTSPREFTDNGPRDEFSIAIVSNSSVDNPSFVKRLRLQGTTVFYMFHEPVSVWDWKNHMQEAWQQIVRFPFSVYFTVKTLRLSSGVIVPSLCAKRYYEKFYLQYNHNVNMMPLLYDNEVTAESVADARSRKQFMGFVGSASKGHGFDSFINFAKHAVKAGSTIPFQIVTRRDLSKLLQSDKELFRYVHEGKIKITHGRVLSNSEINKCYLECFCVWNIYRRSMQSGVLPRSFMAGTPVLASRVGSFPEYVIEKVTGEYADLSENPAAILSRVEKIRNCLPTYVDGCRKKFAETFYYKANRERLAAIIESTKNAGGSNPE